LNSLVLPASTSFISPVNNLNFIQTDGLISSAVNSDTFENYQALLSHDRTNINTILWDGCCSMSVTNNLDHIVELHKLEKPIFLGGVTGGIYLTHCGQFKYLPMTNNVNKVFYSKDASTTLLSLGWLQRCGGKYNTNDNDNSVTIRDPNNNIINVPRLTDNNLLPASIAKLQLAMSRNPSLYQQAVLPSMSAYFSVSHATAEQRKRCELAQDLIFALGFPSDASLILDIDTGKIPGTILTGNDIKLNRLLRGPCPHADAGKRQADPTPSSQSAPATTIGGNLCFDIEKLPEATPGGFTHNIRVVDEKSGYLSIAGCMSKSSAAIGEALLKIIAVDYLAFGHKVEILHGDSEQVNMSLLQHLGSKGIRLQLSLPGQHQARIERYTRTLRERCRAMLSPLPHIVPAKYTHQLQQAAAAHMNNSINSVSYPHVPNELVKFRKMRQIPVQFGSTHMITQLLPKRTSFANNNMIPINQVSKTELGVCLGQYTNAGGLGELYVVANGSIVIRHSHFKMSPTYVAFNWTPKAFIEIVPLSKEPLSGTNMIPIVVNNMIPSSLALPQSSDTSSSILRAINPSNPSTTDTFVSDTNIDPNINVFSSQNQPIINNTYASQINNSLPSPLPPANNLDMVPNLVVESPIITPLAVETPHAIEPINRPAPVNVIAPPLLSPSPPIATRQFYPRAAKSSSHLGSLGLSAVSSRYSYLLPKSYSSILNTKYQNGAITRKLLLSRLASTRNRQYKATLNIGSLSNKSTDILPDPPPPPKRSEISIDKAMLLWKREDIDKALDKELTKIFTTYNAMKIIPHSDIEPTAIIVRSNMLMKKKLSGVITARLALDGENQPEDSYSDTYAATSDVTNKLFIIATSLQDAANRDCLDKLEFTVFDIPGAFLHNRLTREMTGGHQIVTQLPFNLPDKNLAGQWCEVLACMYGLKQSNAVFDKDFRETMIAGGFNPTVCDPRTYIKFSATNPLESIKINMHVDDGFNSNCDAVLKADLINVIRKRYGPDVVFETCNGVCGFQMQYNDDHSITVHLEGYNLKLLTKAGMDKVPPALTPSLPGFFNAPTDTTPVDIKHYQSNNGGLIYTLPIRGDIRKETIHLCHSNSNPTVSDKEKQTHLLRYVKGTPSLGPTFNAIKDPLGVRICGASDAAHAVHTDGSSQSANTISVGDGNAPFYTHSGAERSFVSPDACGAEYIALGRCAKNVLYFRQFAEELGYPQNEPSVIYQDNQSAIKLTVAPAISKKSRYMFTRHHFIRSLYENKQIIPVHRGTHDNAIVGCDLMTKTLGPGKFLYGRSILLNMKK